MKTSGNILFSGVGGQGILLASEVTVYALLECGFDAKKSEVHGMAQRGGSVVAHLRFGKKVYSPLIDAGDADIAIAFEMMEAVRRVGAGGRYISAPLAEKLALDLLDKGDKPRHRLLSAREYEVFCQIAAGKTLSQIAADLSLSIKTISTNRSRILEKMNMSTNAQLTHYAFKNDLVD